MQGMLGDLIVWWAAPFWWQWTMAEGTVAVLNCKISNPIHRGFENWKTLAIKQIKIYAEYWAMGPKALAVCQVHLGVGLSSSAQVADKPALALGTMSRFSAQISLRLSEPIGLCLCENTNPTVTNAPSGCRDLDLSQTEYIVTIFTQYT